MAPSAPLRPPSDGQAGPTRWSGVVSTRSRGHHRHRPPILTDLRGQPPPGPVGHRASRRGDPGITGGSRPPRTHCLGRTAKRVPGRHRRTPEHRYIRQAHHRWLLDPAPGPAARTILLWPGVCGWGVWDRDLAGVGFDQDPWTGRTLWRPTQPERVSCWWAWPMSSCSGLMPALVTRRWWCRWNVRRTGPQIRSTHYAFTAAYPAARKASSKSALNSTNVARSRLVPGNASRTVVTAIRAACPTG